MPWTSGTATNHADLLTKLRDFLTADTDLVNAGQEWTVVGGVGAGPMTPNDFVSLKGQGLAGSDEIFLSLQAYTDVPNNHHNVSLRGHTFYDAGSPTTDPIGMNSQWVSLLLVDSPIVYWFIANGRCFKVITRVNGRYDAMYGGFMLPEHLPGDWSYPMFIGGAYFGQNAQASSDAYSHTNFWNPTASSSTNTGSTQALVFSPIQSWVPLRNRYGTTESQTEVGRVMLPWWDLANQKVKRQLDGEPWLERAQAAAVRYASGSPDRGGAYDQVPEGGQFLGSLDGVFYTPAVGATAEQIAPVGGVDHLLVPNIFRTGDGEWAAFALE